MAEDAIQIQKLAVEFPHALLVLLVNVLERKTRFTLARLCRHVRSHPRLLPASPRGRVSGYWPAFCSAACDRIAPATRVVGSGIAMPLSNGLVVPSFALCRWLSWAMGQK